MFVSVTLTVLGTQVEIYAVDVIGFCYWNLLITVVSSGDADVFIAPFWSARETRSL
jgi:hypothetical protein